MPANFGGASSWNPIISSNYVNSVNSVSLWIRDFEIPASLVNPAENRRVFVFIDFLPVFVLLWPSGKGEDAKEWETQASGRTP
jgi:hypothetical protein